MSLLSPVFYMSCFAEDEIELLVAQLENLAEQETGNDDEQVEKSLVKFQSPRKDFSREKNLSEYQEKQIRSLVQGQLYQARSVMHKIVLAFVSNVSSRNAMLEYLRTFIRLNFKRNHLNVSVTRRVLLIFRLDPRGEVSFLITSSISHSRSMKVK